RHCLSTVLFPEGTRSRDGRLQALKPGSFQMPADTGIAVQPVAIVGSAAILPKGAWGPLRSGVVEVRVGEPIATAEYAGSAGRKALGDRVRAELLALGVPDSSPP